MEITAEALHRTVPLKELLKPENVRPFYATAVIWLAIGAVFAGDLRAFLILASAVLLDLFLLLKVVASLLVFMSHRGRSGETVSKTSLAIWLVAKLAGFGILLAAILLVRNAHVQAVLLGLGTFAVIPLFGGLWWGQRNLRPESSDYAWE